MRHVVMFCGICLVTFFSSTFAAAGGYDDDGICSKTAYLAFKACARESGDDFLIFKANCLNIVDDEAREECYTEARAEKTEKTEECEEVYDARSNLCDKLGESAYDVRNYWVADSFVDPLQIGGSITVNPYFPLVPGSKSYQGGDETITVTVTTQTKLINGVTCVTVNDVVEVDGQPVEDTNDWYAQDIYGNVWYCGEISKNYEYFEGDNPQNTELVDIEGSWKAFRDMAQPGIIMKANPETDDIYRQEMSLGDAEDIAEVISNTADAMLIGDNCVEDGEAIAVFIENTCNNDCLVTKEYTPLDPGHIEHKYYAPGLGFILETNPDGECVIPQGAI